MLMIVHPLKLSYRMNYGEHEITWTFHSEENLEDAVAEISRLLKDKLEPKPTIISSIGVCDKCHGPIFPNMKDVAKNQPKKRKM